MVEVIGSSPTAPTNKATAALFECGGRFIRARYMPRTFFRGIATLTLAMTRKFYHALLVRVYSYLKNYAFFFFNTRKIIIIKATIAAAQATAIIA